MQAELNGGQANTGANMGQEQNLGIRKADSEKFVNLMEPDSPMGGGGGMPQSLNFPGQARL